MRPLFEAYPEIRRGIDYLCQDTPWCVTGVSALLHFQGRFFFEITKPKHWRHRQDGRVLAGIGGIGGSVEDGETLLGCLQREAREEVGTTVRVRSAPATYLLYEEQLAASLSISSGKAPVPLLLTISRNLYRRKRYADYGILAIVTYMAELSRAPSLGDLFGLLDVPAAALPAVFCRAEITIEQLQAMPGVRVVTQHECSPKISLAPVWTGRSVQILVQAGLTGNILARPSP